MVQNSVEFIFSGTTLIVDKPLFTVVPEVLDSTGEYCNYCLKKLFGGIPCHDCVVVSVTFDFSFLFEF